MKSYKTLFQQIKLQLIQCICYSSDDSDISDKTKVEIKLLIYFLRECLCLNTGKIKQYK